MSKWLTSYPSTVYAVQHQSFKKQSLLYYIAASNNEKPGIFPKLKSFDKKGINEIHVSFPIQGDPVKPYYMLDAMYMYIKEWSSKIRFCGQKQDMNRELQC